MRILFAIKSLSLAPGGAERVLATIASELAKRGHRITVASLDDPQDRDFYPISKEVERVRLGRIPSGRSRARELIARIGKFRQVCAETKTDVAVGFMHSSFIPLAVALLGSGIPIVASERTSYRHYRHHFSDKLLLHLSFPLIETMTVNGVGIRDGFPKKFRRRMVALPNPVARAPRRADLLRNPKTLLSVGAFRPEKDHKTLIQAFARIRSGHPDWVLRLVGDGSLRSELEDLARNLGVQDCVEFAGVSASVETEYLNAQLFVLPSLYEAFPNALAEALAHGLPAAGFADCPGTNELIVDGVNGVLVPGDDRIEALAKGLGSLMGSAETRQRMGSAAAASVASYSLDQVADSWERLLAAVSSKSGPPPGSLS